MRRISDRGQMELSFGMIFSIILIIVFLAFAFYAIKKFLGIQDSVLIGNFLDDLSTGVNKMWGGSQGSQPVEYSLPKRIEYVCFVDFSARKGLGAKKDIYDELEKYFKEGDNLVFYPLGSSKTLRSKEIEHIDIAKMTEDDNPLCIENKDGKVKMTIKKNFEEDLVIIS